MKNNIKSIKKNVVIGVLMLIITILTIGAVGCSGCRRDDKAPKETTTVADETATEKSGEATQDNTSEEYATPSDVVSGGDHDEESGEGKTEPSDNNDGPTHADREEEEGTEGEKETEPVTDSVADGTLAPTEPVTIPPTVAPTVAPTEAPTPAPTEAPTTKPLTDTDKFVNAGGTYVANSDGTVTVNYANVKGDVVIPNTIDGKKVEIEYAERWRDTTITSLYIDAEVIPDYAFNGCKALVSVTLGPNVKTIGESAFRNCTNLETITFVNNEKVTEIPVGFIVGCPKVSSLTLPRSVTKVHLLCIEGASTYVSAVYPATKPMDIDYASIVPPFTLYTYSEPGEILVWYEDWDGNYFEYPEGLEAVGMDRYANFSVVYLN